MHLLCVRGSSVLAQVADCDLPERVTGRLQARLAAHLDAAVRRPVLVHEDARACVVLQMALLDPAAVRDDVEPAVAPAVPDRRQEHAAVTPVGGEDGDERLVE